MFLKLVQINWEQDKKKHNEINIESYYIFYIDVDI